MKKHNISQVKDEAKWMLKYAKHYWGAILLYCVRCFGNCYGISRKCNE